MSSSPLTHSPTHRRTRSLGGAISDSESTSSPSTSSLNTPPPPRRSQDDSPLEQTTAVSTKTAEPAATPLVENALADKETDESLNKDVVAKNGTGEAASPPVEEGTFIGGEEGTKQQSSGETKEDAVVDTPEDGERTGNDTDLVQKHHAVPAGPPGTGANDEGQPPAHENGIQSEEMACNVPQIHTSATPTAEEQTHLSPPSSLPTSPPPTSPDSLANDVQTLLEEIRAPLFQVNSNSNNNGQARGLQPVLLPTVNRESNYYRHSVKKRGRRRREEELPASAEVSQHKRL